MVLILISLKSIDEAKDSIGKVYENDEFKLEKRNDVFGYTWPIQLNLNLLKN